MLRFVRFLPIAVFSGFTLALLAATIYYSPSWGLMDDLQNLGYSERIINSPAPFQALGQKIWDDATNWGIFRPVYHLWVVSVYTVFRSAPTAIYLLIILLNMSALLVWGLVFFEFFRIRKKDFLLTVFLFPLSFFLFTPFWNIFMYISLQEKFVVLFGALSLYFFKKSYDAEYKRHILFCLTFALLALLSKPTSIFLWLAYIAFAFLDIVLFKYRPAVSRRYAVLAGLLAGAYVYFSFAVQLKGQYTTRYSSGLNPWALSEKILSAPLIIKGLFLLGISASAFWVGYFWKKKDRFSPFILLLPLGLLAYLMLLAPWGYQSYLLCALAPLIMGTLFPVYVWFNERSFSVKMASNIALILLLCFVFAGIISPRIVKMSEIARVEKFMLAHASPGFPHRYFFPPPYEESANALRGFTSEEIIFLKDGELTGDMLDAQGSNFLIVNDQCSFIHVSGVRLEKKVFINGTWEIRKVIADKTMGKNLYGAQFHLNFVQKIKKWIRDLQ